MTCQVVDMTINNECHVRVELDYYSRVLSYILQGAVCRGFLVFVTYHNKDRTYAYDVGNISSAKFIITYIWRLNVTGEKDANHLLPRPRIEPGSPAC